MKPIKQIYSNVKENLGKKALYISAAAIIATTSGCAGMGSGVKYDNNTREVRSTAISAETLNATQLPNIEKALQAKGLTLKTESAQPDSYEKAITPPIKLAFNKITDKEIDGLDGIVNEKTPTKYDILAVNYPIMTLPEKVSMVENTNRIPTADILVKLTKKDILNSVAKKYDSNVVEGGHVSFSNDGYIAIPKGNGPFFDMLNVASRKRIEDLVKDVKFENVISYNLKQDNNVVANLKIFEVSGSNDYVRAMVKLGYNGYSISPVLLNKEDIEKERKEYDKTGAVSHQLSDEAKGRYGIDVLTAGGAALVHPGLGLILFANLYNSNGFGKVISCEQITENKPGIKLGQKDIESITNPTDPGYINVFQPVLDEKKNLKGIMVYNIGQPLYDILISSNEIGISEKNKMWKDTAEKLLITGATIGVYQFGYVQGKNSVDIPKYSPPTGITGGRVAGPGAR